MSAPRHNPALDETPLSVFEGIVRQARRSKAGRVIPLHQGKTAFTTPVPLRDWDADEFDLPAYLDGPTCGTPRLLDAIRARLTARLGREIDPLRLQVTAGITHGLAVAFHCVLQPGDEVIVLSPRWLFAEGLIRAAGGVPVDVPAFPVRRGDAPGDLAALITAALTPRTRAIYFNSPNNPTGHSLSASDVSVLTGLAREYGLWLVSDNAYELYDFSPGGFVDAVTLDGRDGGHTFAAYSFSKSYGLTGYRIGYLLAPPSMAERARKFALHSVYSPPTCCQYVALRALEAGPARETANVAFIEEALALTVARLQVPAPAPSGGFYAFLDLADWTAGTEHFIERCIERGVSLAPGRAFGRAYGAHARLCFSVVPHAELVEGIEIVNDVYRAG